MKRLVVLAALIMPMMLTGTAAAQGTKPITSGAVIRGLALPGIPIPGTSTGFSCDFSRDDVDQAGRLTGSSVNCGREGTTAQNIIGLPAYFTAYCVTKAPVKSARLLHAPIPGNANHCDLSGITPKNAAQQFKAAIWR